jgi:acyl carrier protein
MDTIEQKLRAILTDHFAVDEDQLQADNHLVSDLDLDSLELVELALQIEEVFNIEVPDNSVTADMTVGDVVEKIRELTGK